MRRLTLTTAVLALAACGEPEPTPTPAPDVGFQERLQTQLLDAKPGDVIEVPAGRYAFDRSLSLTADGVTIRGAGMGETVLSFAGQVAGAEGLLVTGDDFLI